jgi:hypothetical protein
VHAGVTPIDAEALNSSLSLWLPCSAAAAAAAAADGDAEEAAAAAGEEKKKKKKKKDMDSLFAALGDGDGAAAAAEVGAIWWLGTFACCTLAVKLFAVLPLHDISMLMGSTHW